SRLITSPRMVSSLSPAAERASTNSAKRGQPRLFTSPGLDRDNLLALLDSCLLTDAEYAAGTGGWKHLSHAFDELLDPAM
ncbi:cobalamin biosynthesis protein CobW, partial [Streptomyces asiaticus]